MTQNINHIGIILDGNRRYAKAHGKNPIEGHEEGAKNVKEIIDEASKLNVDELSLYVFSTENFNRPKIEVEFLMKLFKKAFLDIEKNEDYIKKYKIIFAGDKTLFSVDIQKIMESIEEKTKNNSGLKINFCMGYGGRGEIVNAVKNIINNKVKIENIDEKTVLENLYVTTDVDLIIRTSGEKRTSGFLPYQATYAELIFLDKYWPEFSRQDLSSCIEEFNTRKRRFGK